MVVAACAVAPLAASSLAVLPVPQGASEPAISARIHDALIDQLAAHFTLVDPQRTRDAMRRLRLRSPEAAGAEALARLAGELGADLLASASVHDAAEGLVPEIALSLRLYEGRRGRLVWTAFHGRSGLDRGRWLGLGTIDTLDPLAPAAVAELLQGLAGSSAVASLRPAPGAGTRIAIVPFTSTVELRGIETSQAATEAVRVFFFERGAALAEPGCVREGLRRQRGAVWGELAADARRAIVDACGAARLLTGSVERWDRAGSGRAPEPTVALALRLLDGESGRILWAGSLEASGFDRSGPFGARRIYSRGSLLERLTARLGRKLLDSPAGADLTEARR